MQSNTTAQPPSKGGHTPKRVPTKATQWLLVDGHLSTECSFTHGGAPECPACLVLVLFA